MSARYVYFCQFAWWGHHVARGKEHKLDVGDSCQAGMCACWECAAVHVGLGVPLAGQHQTINNESGGVVCWRSVYEN